VADDDDVVALSSGIENAHPELRQLQLIGLNVVSATSRFRALQGNATLQFFSLRHVSFNSYSDDDRFVSNESRFLECEVSLSTLLANNSTLTKLELDVKLNLYACDRQHRLQNSLVVGLGVNRTLQRVCFNCGGDVPPELSLHLVQMLEGNTSLHEFIGFHCKLESDRAVIQRYLTLNRYGRGLLRESPEAVDAATTTAATVRQTPLGFWPIVLAPIVADGAMDALFYFLKRMSQTVFQRGTAQVRMPTANAR